MPDELKEKVELSPDHLATLDVLPDACAVVDPDGSIIAVNACWRDFAVANGGDARTFYVGTNYLRICERAVGRGEVLASLAANGLADVLAGNDRFQCEYPCHSKSERRWFEEVITPIIIRGVRCALVMHRNVTTRKLHQIALRDSVQTENELAALVASSTDPIISFDLEGKVVTWNAAAETLYGYSSDEIIGRSLEVLYPPGWPMRIGDYIGKIVAGELRRFEVVRRTKSGELRDIAISAAPVRNSDGEIITISNIHRDITEQKRQHERQEAITRELTHRTKNMLAVILAIERQTARGATSVADFHERFAARLGALSESTDLLVDGAWTTVSLGDLARRQLAAFSDARPEALSIDGPAAFLKPQAVHALGMAFHELATNAAKYGAFAQPDGRLELNWRLVDDNGPEVLAFRWEESGIAVEGDAGARGFGHAVLTGLCSRSLGTEVEYDIGPTSVRWSIDLPREHFTTAR